MVQAKAYVLRVRVRVSTTALKQQENHIVLKCQERNAGKTNDQNRSKQILMCVIFELGLNSLKDHTQISQTGPRRSVDSK